MGNYVLYLVIGYYIFISVASMMKTYSTEFSQLANLLTTELSVRTALSPCEKKLTSWKQVLKDDDDDDDDDDDYDYNYDELVMRNYLIVCVF